VILLGKDGVNVAKSIEFNIGATLALSVTNDMTGAGMLIYFRRFYFISLII